jgi:hypothetical protein
LNKLASSIAIRRNAAGIHYRSDYVHGVLLGEAVAIGLLKEQLNTYNEEYSFTCTKFKGPLIVVLRTYDSRISLFLFMVGIFLDR